ncbi:hypothetical protein L202_03185 [Cryptococcus amylolentus CBS 6039]|uniref:Autophagy-related protein n=1 Tax=Cryptococcus amylolentus CBS 6039 TaxID=1295533 RepID=A0A1E3HXN3_9TREE|nr:hypothetical protein L202_03185 [Cryptococcus amylolentus CBS 6039]ODN81090.1 hypothetical protein L202_03185 [Cryptococcus amylolentus CBS 6039]
MGFSLPPPHLRAWYSYAFAAEVFSACALAIFLPITLEQMAREVGFYAPDLLEPCQTSSDTVEGIGRVCKAKIMGAWIDTASFSMYVKSVAVAFQAICIISVGPLADSTYWRKRLLITFAYSGSIAATLFLLFPHSSTPLLSALLNIISGAAYSTSIVCANAFLPQLAREDEDVRRLWDERMSADVRDEGPIEQDEEMGDLGGSPDSGDEATHLLPHQLVPAVMAISTQDLADADPAVKTSLHDTTPESRYDALLSLTTSRLSSIGIAVGFFSGVSVLILLLIPVLALDGSTFSLRLGIGMSGIWWAVFTIPAWLGLPSNGGDRSEISTRQIKEAWVKMGSMIAPSQIRQLPGLYTYLLAWIFLSDGFHTTTYAAILYASSVLSMSPPKIILVGILVQLAAVISSTLVPRLHHRLSTPDRPITNFNILICCVLAAIIIPVYTSLGLVVSFGGLRTEGEMYVLAIWFGLIFGPFLSYSRAVYAELIPPGHESTFFSLFSFTDKSASFIGPAAVGLISDLTGNIRYGFLFLLVMLVVPIPVLWRVGIAEGRRDAVGWAERVQGRGGRD